MGKAGGRPGGQQHSGLSLTKQLKGAGSCQKVLQLVQQAGHCSVRDLTTAVNQMAKLGN